MHVSSLDGQFFFPFFVELLMASWDDRFVVPKLDQRQVIKFELTRSMEFSFILNMWNEWNIRGFVMLSLSFQIFLILFASLRKKTANLLIYFFLWLAYLMADWVAAFAIGLITHNQVMPFAHTTEVDGVLRAFWASFILLHLGGPDTIAAFSVEDSSLWRRHLLSTIFQVGAAVYVFVQTFLSDKRLVIPTMLVFSSGVIKIAERLLALYLSSFPRLRESTIRRLNVSTDYSRYANEMIEELKVFGDGYSDEEEAKLAESIVVKHAYYYYRNFKFFLGEIVLDWDECDMSREYFRNVSAMDALRVLSVQLHFIYEVFHTKALAIHSKQSYIFRFVAFTSVAMALILFNCLDKHRFPKLDVEITYILLFGGIAIDVIALLMLVFSSWTVARIKWFKTGSSKLDSFLLKLVSAMDDLRKPRFAICEAKSEANVTYTALDTPLALRKWSESIFACNLLSESLKVSPRKVYKGNRCWSIIAFSDICSFSFHMVEKIISRFHHAGKTIVKGCGMWKTEVIIVNTKHVSKNPFMKELWIFIFKEVRRKSEHADDLKVMKEIFEARGDVFLQSSPRGIDCGNLLKYVTQMNYGNSILAWHLATEIWYDREKQCMSNVARNDEKEVSKILSDYMLYLFLNQANSMPNLVDVFHVASAAMLSTLRNYIADTIKDVEGLCKTLYEDENRLRDLNPTSPLSMGIKLAKDMERLEEMKWKVMSGVWVEMLSYAAGHTKVEAHIQVLGKGGELLTFVWLLMVHFGVFNYVSDVPQVIPSP